MSLFVSLGTLRAVQVPVYVSFFGLDPDPVHISPGDAVYWIDEDLTGPYRIYAYPSGQFWTETTDGYPVYAIQFNQAGTYRYRDDAGDLGTIIVGTPNLPPTVSVTSPTNNAVFTAPANFSFTATASDPDSDGLAHVVFYVGADTVGDIYSPPFTTSVTNLAAGSYTLTAIAYDNGGANASSSVSITVNPGQVPPTNYLIAAASATIDSSGTVDTANHLGMGPDTRGALEFAAFDPTLYSSVRLALSPYYVPLSTLNLDVYGFDGGTGTLYSSNYNSGTFVGTIVFPANITYYELGTLDVTPFVRSAKGPYFGFILRAPGVMDLCSLAANWNYDGGKETRPELIAAVSIRPPALVTKRFGNQIVISWDTNNATGLALQSTTNLTSSSTWKAVITTPVLVGSQMTVTNPIVGTKQFFRLSNQ